MTLGARGLLVAVGVAGVVNCGGGGDGGNGNSSPIVIAKAAPDGNAQTGPVFTALALPLRVVVTENGAAKADAEVGWSVLTGGGSITAKDTTDASGIASATWTLGQTAGAQTARATLTGASGSPVGFSATATALPAANLAKVAGDNQTAVAGTAFTTALRVKVTDVFGNPVQGATVNWAHSGSVTTPATSTSAANGDAVVVAVAGGSAGAPSVNATVVGAAGNPSFALTVIVPTRTVQVGTSAGNNFFASAANGTTDPAVDTVAVGDLVLWSSTGGSHTVESINGPPSFTSSGTLTLGQFYYITFNAAGTYQYDCAIHGAQQMSGRVVVQ